MQSSYLKACLALLVAGSVVSTAVAQVPSPFTAVSDVGGPTKVGSVVKATDADGIKEYTQVGGGADIWGTSDAFNYAYQKFTGDFDVSLKVRDLQGPDGWSKVELMAREGSGTGVALSHVGGDRFIANMTTRSGGQNQTSMQYRQTTGGDAGEPGGTYGAPTYPNTWLRLQRQGNVFILYTSTDDVTWTEGGRQDTATWPGGALATTLSVGIAVTAHNNGDTTGAVAIYSNLKGFFIDLNAPPAISNLLPASRAAALKAADVVLSFSVVRAEDSTNSINANGIAVVVNGVDKTSSLQVTGTGDQRDATMSGFATNLNYTVAITVTDTHGSVTTASLQFDTMSSTSGSFTIEAEDYNYTDATSGQAGLFIDNPQPSSVAGANTYFDLVSTEGIDVHQFQTNGSRVYRTTDLFVGTEANGDYLRQKYVDALVNDLGVLDYNVGWFEVGEWLNYTRTFPATGTGYYLVYARLATANAGTFSATLDQVTSGATTTSQTLVGLGSFISPTTGGWQSYNNVPLTDALGVPMVVHLTGKQTVRFTLVTGGVNINYLVFAPTAAPSTQPAALLASNPAKDATGVLPNNPISATITDKDTKVVSSTIKLKLNGADVAATVTPTASGATVFYQSPDFYAMGSTNVVTLIFSDNATPAHSITNTWQFTVVSITRIPAAFAKLPGTGQTPGFSARLVKATSTPATQASIATIESLLAGNVPLNVWAFETPQVINYWRSGGVGNFPNDTPNFPGVDATAIDISMEIVAYMELSRGVYRFGVNSDDGFRLTSGATPGDTNLVICQFNAGRGVADTTGDFLVESNGIYPMRLIYQNGGSDGAVEFFSVNLVTGVRTLINDSTVAGYVKAYRFDTAMTNTITFTTQPASRTAGANSSATFNVAAVSGSIINPAVFVYQWRKDGVDIVGANRPTYTLPMVAFADAGKYRCVVTLLGYQPANSAEATLTVVDDKTPPTVYSVVGSATLDTVTVAFSESVEYNSAAAAGSYSISGLTILNAALSYDAGGVYASNVVLTTTPQAKGVKYTLTVNNVTDLSANPVVPNTKMDFTAFVFMGGFMIYDIWDNITSGNAGGLQSNQRVIDNQFDRRFLVSESQTSNAEHGDNYGGRLSGYIVAPETGNYRFYIAGDDTFELYLSTDENPATKVMIADLTSGWTAYQGWDTNASQTSASIPLVAGAKYYMAAFWKEGGGGDYVNVAWSTPSSPGTTNIILAANIGIYVNADLASITISQQPTNVTVVQGRTGTFSVVATGTSSIGTNLFYQWQKDGVNITNATNSSYTTPPVVLADDNAQFKCVVSLSGKSLESTSATLAFAPDAIPPALTSAFGLVGSRTVTVNFNEKVDPATAANTANYTVNGVAPTSAVLSPNGASVVLTMATLTGATANVLVSNIKDLANNTIASGSAASAPLNSSLTAIDIGTPSTNATTGVVTNDPLEPGLTSAVGASDFDVRASGTDIWETHDGFHLVYEGKTGDFDVVVRVQRLDPMNNWSKAGLMARENLTPGSRNLAIVVEPAAVPTADGGTGANQYEAGYRPVADAASMGWANGGQRANGVPPYPNAWVRLKRAGNEFRGFRSYDGSNWIQIAQMTIDATTTNTTGFNTPYPATIYVGMATTSHNNNTGNSTVAEYRSYGNYVKPAKPEVLFVIGGGAPNAADQAVISRLATKGYLVTGIPALSALTADATGKALVIVSSTVGSGDVAAKYRDVAVPVIVWENGIYDDMGMTGVDAAYHASTAGLTNVTIVNASHPMAAGLAAGAVTVTTIAETFTWGIPNSNAVIIANLPAGQAAIFGYETGAAIYTGTAAARRVGLFLQDNTFASLTGDGMKLFDAAVAWAAAAGVVIEQPKLTISKTANKVTIAWPQAGSTLQSTPSIPATWTDVAGSATTNSVEVPIGAANEFFRLK